MAQILVVDDEQSIRKFLRISLTASGHSVSEAQNAEECLALCQHETPDLILLDLTLPDMDGQEIITTLREHSPVQIIVLSARSTEADKVEAMDRGADDYLVKPFSVGELMARVRVALRHASRSSTKQDIVECGDLRINLARKIVSRNGAEIRLTKREFALLQTLTSHADHVLSHEQIIEAVWGNVSHLDGIGYLRGYIKQLRGKLEKDPTNPCIIITDPGIGYRLRSSGN